MYGFSASEISASFTAAGLSPIRCGRATDWKFAVGSVWDPLHVGVDYSCGWIRMECPLPVELNGIHSAWDYLLLNGTMEGPVRVCTRNEISFGLRADIVIPDRVEDLTARIKGAEESMRKTRKICRKPAASASSFHPLSDQQCQKIREFAQETESNVTEYESLLWVTLNVPDRLFHACIDGLHGSIRISVMIADVHDLRPVQKEAIARALLSLSKRVRMARPSAILNKQGFDIVVLEILLGDNPSAEELGRGLSALAFSCQIIGDEVAAMRNETVAREYLSLTRWPRVNKDENHKRGEDHEYFDTEDLGHAARLQP